MFIILALYVAAVAAAAPAGPVAPAAATAAATTAAPVNPVVVKAFPGIEEFGVVEYDGKSFTILGEELEATVVNSKGECVTLTANSEDGIGHISAPMNATHCAEIESTVCDSKVANLTCNSAVVLGPNGHDNGYKYGNGYPHGGPLCHIVHNDIKIRPAEHFRVFSCENFAMCSFQIAAYVPPPPTTQAPVAKPAAVNAKPAAVNAKPAADATKPAT